MIILNIYVYDKKMHLVKLENNTKKEIFDQVALLHKKSLKKTIASTLSVSSLSNVYFILVRSGIFGILIAQEDSKVVGVLSYKNKNKKYSTKLLLTLVIYSINGFFKNPIVLPNSIITVERKVMKDKGKNNFLETFNTTFGILASTLSTILLASKL